MSGAPDIYAQIVHSPPGRVLARQLGLPMPVRLERHRPGAGTVSGPVLVGAAPGGRLLPAIERTLEEIRAPKAAVGAPPKALVFDATGISESRQLLELHRFFHPSVSSLQPSGRVLVTGTRPEGLPPRHATAQRALEGFTRSLGKEIGRGVTVQLVYVAQGCSEQMLDSTVRFLLSPKSAYVSGQVVRISEAVAPVPEQLDWEKPLRGRLALVTGASRGIGRAIAQTLRRDGANLMLLDVPALSAELSRLASALGGQTIELDITEDDAPRRIAERLASGLDIVVHNAGITRDRTLAKMPEDRWSAVVEVNLTAQERINEELLSRGLLAANGRVICVSSMSGIAGNAGQTNYATSKAGVIGMVQALAGELASRQATINAVAPGFIETQMTAKMPFGLREAGRRMNSMAQGGLPVDVAETIAWLANPASSGVNGNVIRVCGQSLLGA